MTDHTRCGYCLGWHPGVPLHENAINGDRPVFATFGVPTNARLIAAAPALLAVLKQVAVDIEGVCSCDKWRAGEHQDDPGGDARPGPHRDDCIQVVVRAAIAQAEGEQ